MWDVDPSVLARTMNWVDALRPSVGGGRWIDVGNELEEAPDTHEQALTGVDEVRDHTDHVERHGREASDECWVEIDAAGGEVGSVIGMAQDSYMKIEAVGMDRTEQEVVAWDDDHGK